MDVHCVVSHISTASGRAWKEGRLDVTGAMMVLTLKIISAAACYQDGSKPDKVCLLRQRVSKYSTPLVEVYPVAGRHAVSTLH